MPRPDVESSWLFHQEPHEEYLVKIVTDPGVRNARVEEAIQAAVAYINEVATAEAVAARIIAGRADQTASYVPSPSMYGHEKLAEHDNRAIVAVKAAGIIYA